MEARNSQYRSSSLSSTSLCGVGCCVRSFQERRQHQGSELGPGREPSPGLRSESERIHKMIGFIHAIQTSTSISVSPSPLSTCKSAGAIKASRRFAHRSLMFPSLASVTRRSIPRPNYSSCTLCACYSQPIKILPPARPSSFALTNKAQALRTAGAKSNTRRHVFLPKKGPAGGNWFDGEDEDEDEDEEEDEYDAEGYLIRRKGENRKDKEGGVGEEGGEDLDVKRLKKRTRGDASSEFDLPPLPQPTSPISDLDFDSPADSTKATAQKGKPLKPSSPGDGTDEEDPKKSAWKPPLDNAKVVLEVDLFADKELWFKENKPSDWDNYDSWKDRNDRRSVSSYAYGTSWQIGADELNLRMMPSYLEKHRYVLAPDEAFGAIFNWECILQNWREVELDAWVQLAEEENLSPPDLDDMIRMEEMAPEAAIQRVLFWSSDWLEIKRLLFRKLEISTEKVENAKFELRPGVAEWLQALHKHGTRICLCANIRKTVMVKILGELGVSQLFFSLVSAEQEFDSLEQMYLLACLSIERPPQKCAVFTDRPKAIIAAHEVSCKAVAVVQAYKTYELKIADATLPSFENLVVYNIRRLFSQLGSERMDPQTETEKPQTTKESQVDVLD